MSLLKKLHKSNRPTPSQKTPHSIPLPAPIAAKIRQYQEDIKTYEQNIRGIHIAMENTLVTVALMDPVYDATKHELKFIQEAMTLIVEPKKTPAAQEEAVDPPAAPSQDAPEADLAE